MVDLFQSSVVASIVLLGVAIAYRKWKRLPLGLKECLLLALVAFTGGGPSIVYLGIVGFSFGWTGELPPGGSVEDIRTLSVIGSILGPTVAVWGLFVLMKGMPSLSPASG